jgi:hypothetical protein
MLAKLKLGMVVLTSAAVYVGVWKMADATFQYVSNSGIDCPDLLERVVRPVVVVLIKDWMNAPSLPAGAY